MQDLPTPINWLLYIILESPIIIYLNKYVYEAMSIFIWNLIYLYFKKYLYYKFYS